MFANFVDYHFAALIIYNNDILVEIITPTPHLFVLEEKICNQIRIREIKYRPVDIFLMQELATLDILNGLIHLQSESPPGCS